MAKVADLVVYPWTLEKSLKTITGDGIDRSLCFRCQANEYDGTRIIDKIYNDLEHNTTAITCMVLLSRYSNCQPKLRKTNFCLCDNIGADQLCSNCTADQRLCFRDTDSTVPLLPKSEILSF